MFCVVFVQEYHEQLLVLLLCNTVFVPVGNNLIFEVLLYIICSLEFKIRVIVVLGFKLLLMGSLGTLAFSWPKFF